jgi:ppGpp synthetase/RelA/SpoT-type nucleotidyltranferase
MAEFTSAERILIRELVKYYERNDGVLSTFLQSLRGQVQGSKALRPYIHSLSWRMKDPGHLEDKLKRQLREHKEKGKPFPFTTNNLFVKINDLAGLRILHLYTQQVEGITKGLKELFEEESYRVVEGPTARTWDDESRAFFKSIGIKTKKSPSLYTSVHYVIKPNKKTKYTCEIQVRTLMEEVWGQVDHTINYPHRTIHLGCREQLAALARATSSCTRLVDSIFRSHVDAEAIRQKLLLSRRLRRNK